MKRKIHLSLFPSLIVSVLLLAGPLASCSSRETPEPVVRTTSAPEPLPNDTGHGHKSKKQEPKQAKPKHNIQSFSKNEPVNC